MADPEEQPPTVEGDDEPEETPGYQPPAKKTLEEIQKQDADDESLVRYKQMLLGNTPGGGSSSGPNVVVEKLSLVVEGRPDVELDLTGDLSNQQFVIKEGAEYRLKITFKVNHEIVAGLRYYQVTYRKGIRVDKSSYMVGSYGPKAEPQTYVTPPEEAPKGMMSRGAYTSKSKFTDDDKNVYKEWEWNFAIKKDWE